MYKYYKPSLNAVNIGEKGGSEIEVALINAVNGERTWTEILSELLILGFASNEIDTTIKNFIENQYFLESISSEINNFNQEELEKYKTQLNFFDTFYGEEKSPFSQFNSKSLLIQKKLKDAKILIFYKDFDFNYFAESLNKLGISEIRSIDLVSQKMMSDLKSDISLDEFNTLFSLNISNFNTVVYASSTFKSEFSILLSSICNEAEIKFLPYNNFGTKVEIGPFFIPKQSACYNCFDKRRLGANSQFSFKPTDYNFSINMPIGIELLLIEIFKNESQILEPSSKDNVISMEYLSMNLEHHPVFKLPRCKCCGVHNKRPKNKIWEEI